MMSDVVAMQVVFACLQCKLHICLEFYDAVVCPLSPDVQHFHCVLSVGLSARTPLPDVPFLSSSVLSCVFLTVPLLHKGLALNRKSQCPKKG
uniref:Uncharacterized protein n=1 Tax=Anguilla anguilla TaxID=7936 RepID=A0A0E9RFU3_ANGAN